MDEIPKKILNEIGIHFDKADELADIFLSREFFLDELKYFSVKSYIPGLKELFSSSYLTSLHKDAEKTQKWPLLNLVRQILTVYGFTLEPIRKSDGYTKDGIKKYKRFFQIKRVKQKIENHYEPDCT
uniref:Uncharacterized protein n=1 Tax=viral metagenome TaxID=1070528 RepID=A0A6C0F8L8_9ZZZZ